jgi:hypothetical protein
MGNDRAYRRKWVVLYFGLWARIKIFKFKEYCLFRNSEKKNTEGL